MRISRLLRLGGLLGLLAGIGIDRSGAGENVVYGPPPAWVEEAPATTTTAVTKHASGLVYLLSDYQTDVAREEAYQRNTIKVLAENGLSACGELRLSFEPTYQTLTLHFVRILRDGQELSRLDPAKVKVFRRERNAEAGLYDGRLTALVIVEDLRVGDVLDYAFTVQGRNPVFHGLYADSWWLQGYSPMDRMRVRLLTPESRPLRWQIHDGPAVTPAVTTADGKVEQVWDERGVEGLEYEDDTPAWYVGGPVLQVSEYPDWAAVVAWGRPLYPLDAPLPQELLDFAETIRALPPGPRAAAALHKIQDDVRYLSLSLGESSHRPHPPAEVFAHRFGDCKDKALLLACLLRRLDLDAAPALVDAGAGRDLDRRLPSPLLFDHVIVHLRLDGREYWLDPTDSYQAGELDQHALAPHGWALPLRDDVRALVPVIPPEGGRRWMQRIETYTCKGLTQPVELAVRTIYRGYYAEGLRSHLAGLAADRFATERINRYVRYLPAIKQVAPPRWTDARERNEIVVEESYSIPDYWTFDSAQRRYSCEINPYLLFDFVEKIADPVRRMPLAVTHPTELTSTIIFHLPESWNVKPETTHDATPAFTLDFEVKYADNEIRLDYKYRTTADHVAADRVPEYAQAIGRVRDALGYRLTYTLPAKQLDRPAGKASATDALNWSIVLVALLSFGFAGAAAFQIYRWRSSDALPPRLPTRPDLNGLRGWLILVGIGLGIGLVRALVTYRGFLLPVLNLETWNACTVPGASRYHPLYAPLILAEVVFNTMQPVCLALALGLYFSRKRAFPWVMIALLGGTALFNLGDTIVAAQLPTSSATPDVEGPIRAAGALVAAAVWIPYYRMSKRVQATFLR